MWTKKMICMTAVVCMAAGLTACGIGGRSGDYESDVWMTESEDTAVSVATEETASAVNTDGTEEETEESDTSQTGDTSDEAESEADKDIPDTGAPDGAGSMAAVGDGEYVDFDDMCFYVNGKKYDLGQTTLPEMIDAGVPFDENDLANAGNNLNPNYQSQGFIIDLAEWYTAQVYSFNDTGDNKTIAECYINEVYLPVNQDKEQNILGFNFPLNMTMEELEAEAGEPDDYYHYDGDNGFYTDKYTYEKESEKYYSNSYYVFEFQKGELRYIYITYMP